MSSTAVALNNEIAAPDRWDQDEMIRTLKDTVCKGASDSQFRMFIEVCRSTGLNPLLKEVYFVPGVGVMAGRDGYLRVANENPNFDGMETTVERDAQNKPVKAVCRVWRKDRSHPITCEAYYNEYKKPGNVWQTYPSAMISKVAEVLALKRSFSINGVVTEEEMGSEPEPTRAEKVQAAKDVAEAKLKQLTAPKPEPETILEAQTEELPPAPPAEDNKFKQMLDAFKDMKAECTKLGCVDQVYYATLKAHGVEKSNAFKKFDEARACYKAMGKALIAWRAANDVNPLYTALIKDFGEDRVVGNLSAAHGFGSWDEVPERHAEKVAAAIREALA